MNAVAPIVSRAMNRLAPHGAARGGLALVLAGGLFAVALGLSTSPDAAIGLYLAAGLCVLGLVYVAIAAPAVPLLILFAQAIAFPALPVTETRGANPEDVLLPLMLVVTWMFTRDRAAEGPRADDVERRRRSLLRWVGAYYALAVLSLVLLADHGPLENAVNSFLQLLRSFQGALFFYLVSRHVQGRRDMYRVRNAVVACVFIVLGLNLLAMALGGGQRAGSAIVLGAPSASAVLGGSSGRLPLVMTSPNELGAACVLAWAILIGVRPHRGLFVLGLAASFVLLLMSQSRSGLLSWITLVLLLGLRRGRRKLLLLPLVAVALLPVLPEVLRNRILRTIVLERGSFEAFSSLVRVYSWEISWKVFLAHPVTGVGYLGFRYVSDLYNSLGVMLPTSEQFFLETASGLGFMGPILVLGIGVALARLGRLTRRLGEPGSLARDLGAVTPPFLASVVVGNLTGDNLVGLLGVSQVALFAGLLAQAARIPECQRAAGTAT
jgi:hypothetical protein